MNGIGVSAVTAYTAHREWASRPPDERYASVHALYDAARARRLRTEERTIETVALRTEAVASDALALRDTSGRQAALTNWSFEQLAGIAAAPPKYLRTLPAAIASDAINYGLRRQRREQQQLLVDRDEPWTIHAVTSPRYARVHHDELAGRVLDLMTQHPAWSLPLGYKDGVFGAERVPSGAYLGDRDMFLFLVDGNRDLDDPTDTSHAGLFRGFILRNSDVGAAALTLDVFLFRAVCGNHIIWGFQHVVGFRRRHVGASIQEAWTHHSTASGPRSTPTPRTIASSSCGPRPRNSGRRVTRLLTRLFSDSSCRRSRPRRRTPWRKRSRRIPVRSGATCKGSRV
jgi:hypothetical protein